MAETTRAIEADERWWGWGSHGADEAAAVLLEAVRRDVGEAQPARPAMPLALIDVPDQPLLPAARESLRAVAEVDDAPLERLLASSGASYPDLVRRRRGELGPTPNAIVRPHDVESLAATLRLAAEYDLVVVPRGGGTSDVGGVDATGRLERSGLIALDLRLLARVVDVDPISLRATVEPGIGGPALEAMLRPLGLELGQVPGAFERSTLGGWIATRSISPASGARGSIASLVRAARLVTPTGAVEAVDTGGRSEGPGLLGLVVGSEGALGVVAQATVVVRPRPEAQAGRALLFATFDDALSAMRRLAQTGVELDVALLADEVETPLLLASLGIEQPSRQRGALLVLVASGPTGAASDAVTLAAEACAREEPRDLGHEPARAWLTGRERLPYLRDALIEAGYLVTTIETAAPWRELPHLRAAVLGAVDAALAQPSLVGCQIAHVTADGAALSLRIVAPVAPGEEIERWRRAREAALGAVLGESGALPGIGSYNAGWLARARGRTGESALRAMKDALDPLGVMNPGKLLRMPE
jgi:alkyldihydroxyacetonephosphate synthase